MTGGDILARKSPSMGRNLFTHRNISLDPKFKPSMLTALGVLKTTETKLGTNWNGTRRAEDGEVGLLHPKTPNSLTDRGVSSGGGRNFT